MPTQAKFLAISLISLTLCTSACARDAAQPGGSDSPAAEHGNGQGPGARGRGQQGPVPVTTAKVQSRAVPVVIPAVGTVEAVSTVQIRAQVTGQLSDVHFSEGQEVQKGQPLFTIDPRPFQAALQQAQAVLARDTATATNAVAQTARYEDLYKRGLIPRDQYETQHATTQSAQATLEADRAAVETARLNLAYTRITAPISGRTGALGAHVGDLVRANDTTPLVVINQLAPIYVTFAVAGRYLGDIRRNQGHQPLEVVARGQASLPPGAQPPPPMNAQQAIAGTAPQQEAIPGREPGPSATGKVTFIDNAVDATTGTIKLKATFPNTDHKLWPGLFVEVSLNLSTDRNAIVVPAIAVQTSQAGQYVYVVGPDTTVDMRDVQVERQQGEEMVIARGLSAGEEVVTDGQLRLTPGARIVRVNGSRGRDAGANGRGPL
jgi:multidrug efflux system membrane fusion protein